jgi:hypothetical protein
MRVIETTVFCALILGALSTVQTGALARGGHHEPHARPEIPHDPPDGSGKLHSVLSYGEEGGGKSSAAPAEQPESHLRTPNFGEPEEGSDLATSRGGEVATGNVATGNVATGNANTSHMRFLEAPAVAYDAATYSEGNVATGNVATGSVSTGNAATSHMRTPTYGAAPAEGSDLAARGGDIATGNVATGAHVEGQVHEDDVAAAHPESVPQKQKKSKKQISCISAPIDCNKQAKIKKPIS